MFFSQQQARGKQTNQRERCDSARWICRTWGGSVSTDSHSQMSQCLVIHVKSLVSCYYYSLPDDLFSWHRLLCPTITFHWHPKHWTQSVWPGMDRCFPRIDPSTSHPNAQAKCIAYLPKRTLKSIPMYGISVHTCVWRLYEDYCMPHVSNKSIPIDSYRINSDTFSSSLEPTGLVIPLPAIVTKRYRLLQVSRTNPRYIYSCETCTDCF